MIMNGSEKRTYTHREVFNRIEFELSQLDCGNCQGANKKCPFFTGNVDNYLDPECSKHTIYGALITAKETPTWKREEHDFSCKGCGKVSDAEVALEEELSHIPTEGDEYGRGD